jgi:hypothetical protein
MPNLLGWLCNWNQFHANLSASVLSIRTTSLHPTAMGNHSRNQQRSESFTGNSSCSIPEQSAPKPSPSKVYLYIKMYSPSLPRKPTLLIHDFFCLKYRIYTGIANFSSVAWFLRPHWGKPLWRTWCWSTWYVHVHTVGNVRVQVIKNN